MQRSIYSRVNHSRSKMGFAVFPVRCGSMGKKHVEHGGCQLIGQQRVKFLTSAKKNWHLEPKEKKNNPKKTHRVSFYCPEGVWAALGCWLASSLLAGSHPHHFPKSASASTHSVPCDIRDVSTMIDKLTCTKIWRGKGALWLRVQNEGPPPSTN